MDSTKHPTERPGEPGTSCAQAGFSACGGNAVKQDREKSPEQMLADIGFNEDFDSDVTRYVRDGMELVIKCDEDPQNPRQIGDCLGIMALRPDCDYNFGDEHRSEVPDNAVVVLPLYAHIHCNIALAFSPSRFYDRADTHLLGFIYTTREHMARHWGSQDIPEDEIVRMFKAEVEEMNHYLAGRVFYYVIRDTHSEDGFEDGCGGYYGLDHALLSAVSSIQYHDEQELKAERAAVVYP